MKAKKLTPPDRPLPITSDSATADDRAASLRLATLCKRADFQRAARAKHVAMPGFVLQMRLRGERDLVPSNGIRVGFTCSKKVGNAVARNRAKRRLREVARLTLPQLGKPGRDYVLIGRKEVTAALPFTQLMTDFSTALARLHRDPR